jgi:hypothetical protein
LEALRRARGGGGVGRVRTRHLSAFCARRIAATVILSGEEALHNCSGGGEEARYSVPGVGCGGFVSLERALGSCGRGGGGGGTITSAFELGRPVQREVARP